MDIIDRIVKAASAGDPVEVYDLAAEISGETDFARLAVECGGEALAIFAQKWAQGWACWYCYQPKNAAIINAVR